jgi:DnaK suppressor protein
MPVDAGTLKRLRDQLEQERAQHMELLDEHGADPYSDRVKHLDVGNDGFADSGQATADRSELLAVLDQARTRVQQVDQALQRMDSGDYGICAECGNPIDEGRLEARPLSVTCIDCASRS